MNGSKSGPMPGDAFSLADLAFVPLPGKLYFTAKIQIELNEDAVEYKRTIGMNDTAIIHEVCDELRGKVSPHLTELGDLEFTDCEIAKEKEREKLSF